MTTKEKAALERAAEKTTVQNQSTTLEQLTQGLLDALADLQDYFAGAIIGINADFITGLRIDVHLASDKAFDKVPGQVQTRARESEVYPFERSKTVNGIQFFYLAEGEELVRVA